MAGHSKFSNIKHRKGAQDAKRAKIFTKLSKEIIVAVKTAGGQTDPGSNPRLRSAIIAARALNMPKDRIDKAIKQGTGQNDEDNYEEIRYEGYGVAGVAIIVEAMTNNRNRTAAEVRTIFNKAGGALGETGSVAFMFDRVGFLKYKIEVASNDEIFEIALEVGADNVVSDMEYHEIICEVSAYNDVMNELQEKLGEPELCGLSWQPNNFIDIDDEKVEKIMNLIENLEDCDDVQYVTANVKLDEQNESEE
ncbi:MAG: YebC/PmpR family DNA-binding transcriptional regulator [Pseudomonadota bacterium]